MKIVCRNAHNSKCNNFINDCLILSYIFLSKKKHFLGYFSSSFDFITNCMLWDTYIYYFNIVQIKNNLIWIILSGIA